MRRHVHTRPQYCRILRNIAEDVFTPRQYCAILRNIDVVWTRPLYSYFNSSGISRNIPTRNVRHILCWNIPQYSRRMCIAFTTQNGRLVHTHDNLSPDHQRRQYCAILRNIVRQNWACTALVHNLTCLQLGLLLFCHRERYLDSFYCCKYYANSGSCIAINQAIAKKQT